jgi:hypothetical protein
VIPLPELLSELMVGIGAALFGANLLVLIKARRADGQVPQKGVRPAPPSRPPSIRRVYVNMSIGALVALWGLATILRA